MIIEIRARCANFRPFVFTVQACEAIFDLVNWSCNTLELKEHTVAPHGHVTVSATYPDGSIQSS